MTEAEQQAQRDGPAGDLYRRLCEVMLEPDDDSLNHAADLNAIPVIAAALAAAKQSGIREGIEMAADRLANSPQKTGQEWAPFIRCLGSKKDDT